MALLRIADFTYLTGNVTVKMGGFTLCFYDSSPMFASGQKLTLDENNHAAIQHQKAVARILLHIGKCYFRNRLKKTNHYGFLFTH